jgi:hypothetical protein
MTVSKKDIELRLAAAREGQKRSRFAFLISTVLSLAVIIAGWNAYLSWYRTFALKDAWATNEVTRELQKQLTAEWVKSRTINVSLLGIHVGISDVPFLGSIALCIASIWLFFAVRRVNHVVGLLLRYTRTETDATKETIFNDIIAYLVFLHMTPIDMPIRNLEPKAKQPSSLTTILQHITHLLSQGIATVLLFLPPLAIFASVTLDWFSFYLPSPFREPHDRVLKDLLAAGEWTVTVWENIVAVVLGITTLLLSWGTVSFENATKNILLEFQNTIDGGGT